MTASYIIGQLETKAGAIPKISSTLNLWDKWNAFQVRMSFNRHDYQVAPGLYALGEPTANSPVLVTANYKLTFDFLRAQLKGLNLWILVLDTKGINVWCAAGKGTFGTEELVARLESVKLKEIVEHRKIIVPQLGATGISAREAQKQSGFSVVYGPIRATDLPQFLTNNFEATKEMRQVTFSFYDRLILIPVELIQGSRYFLALSALLTGLSLFSPRGFGLNILLNLLAAHLGGAVVGPLLLPYLPGRSFAVKGFFSGLIMLIILWSFHLLGSGLFQVLSWLILVPTVASFLTMNFTGASTYTSMSGVKKEMRTAVPVQIIGLISGVILFLTSKYI